MGEAVCTWIGITPQLLKNTCNCVHVDKTGLEILTVYVYSPSLIPRYTQQNLLVLPEY